MKLNEVLQELLEKSANEIGAVADSVLIIATYHDGNQSITNAISTGYGDYYARYGAAKEWVMRQEQLVKTNADMEKRQAEEEE